MTVPRMEFIYNAAAAATTTKSPTNLAAAIQWAVNGLTGIGTGTPNINYKVPQSVNYLWSLGDPNTQAHGHCGEASYLMEQALRMIGIPAVQKHVYGSTDTNVLHGGRNVIFEDEAAHKTVGTDVNPQKRNCQVHGEEKLCLMFNRVNAGEGTVEVGGKLYGGLVNKIADSQGGTSAAHQMLLQLQNEKVYQVWVSEKSGVCTSSEQESGAGPANPSVPPA